MSKPISPISGIIVSGIIAFFAILMPSYAQQPISVKIIQKGSGWQMLRNGQPYFIKGAGGDGSKQDLKNAGANSWRTWGADNLDEQLAQAQTLGMTITIGVWLGHKEHGFHYDNAEAVAAQKENARQAILRYRNSPALLMWGLGNEMESGQEDNPAMWNAVEDIAKMAHQLDPHHPTMTVVAEIGGDKIAQINAHCPDIDIIGINSYGGGSSLGQRYKSGGGIKPYVVTEFGPPGTWESEKNAWGAFPELTSTEKAERYRLTYEKGVQAEPMCLGSYAFVWGSKQESSATWYGLRLPDGSKLGAVDALTKLWSGHQAAHLCPVMHGLTVNGSGQTAPGATVRAALDVSDPENDPLTVTWVLQADPATDSAAEAVPTTYPEAIIESNGKSAVVKMPPYGGPYRLYAYVRDTHGGAAVGNVSLDVTGSRRPPLPPARRASLPLIIYGDDAAEAPFIPSGYMGNTGAIKMDQQWPANPHTSKTCIKVSYSAADNWAGVAWQNPGSNWGDKAGGWNLSEAEALSFWARGDKGGEVVTFLFGLISNDKVFHDSCSGKLEKVVLTKDWKRYSIPVSGLDLSRIVTGFAWTLAAAGQPVTFYLDDIRYE